MSVVRGLIAVAGVANTAIRKEVNNC